MKPHRVSAAIAAASVLSACASAPDVAPSNRTVEIPVPVRCESGLGPEPAWPDTDQALRSAPDLFARVQLLAAGRLLRMARDRELSAALKACEG
jgi:hypothetical protein